MSLHIHNPFNQFNYEKDWFFVRYCLPFILKVYAQAPADNLCGFDFGPKYRVYDVDMNLDGKLDKVVVGPSAVFTFFADSKGNIICYRVGGTYTKAEEPPRFQDYALAVEDANGDRIPDMIYTGPVVRFTYYGKKDGSFGPEVKDYSPKR